MTNDAPGGRDPERVLAPEERERIIAAILESRWGIYGAEVCQLCDEIATFSGWAAAVGSHWNADYQFAATRHHHGGEPEHPGVFGAREQARVCELFRASPKRFFEMCQRPVSRESAQRVRHHRLCETCAPEVLRTSQPDRLLHNFMRRRYIGMTHGPDALRRWGKSIGAEEPTDPMTIRRETLPQDHPISSAGPHFVLKDAPPVSSQDGKVGPSYELHKQHLILRFAQRERIHAHLEEDYPARMERLFKSSGLAWLEEEGELPTDEEFLAAKARGDRRAMDWHWSNGEYPMPIYLGRGRRSTRRWCTSGVHEKPAPDSCGQHAATPSPALATTRYSWFRREPGHFRPDSFSLP